jgi:hypothetical protein
MMKIKDNKYNETEGQAYITMKLEKERGQIREDVWDVGG